jgi:hypothetical protein
VLKTLEPVSTAVSDDGTPDGTDEFVTGTDEFVTGTDDVDDLPTVSCTRCGREWDLDYELDELVAGNQAVEQFALDHKRHTGHFPDDVATWLARCRRCPEGVERLSRDAARRWAEQHARHTRHTVVVSHGSDDSESVTVEPGDWRRTTDATDDE